MKNTWSKASHVVVTLIPSYAQEMIDLILMRFFQRRREIQFRARNYPCFGVNWGEIGGWECSWQGSIKRIFIMKIDKINSDKRLTSIIHHKGFSYQAISRAELNILQTVFLLIHAKFMRIINNLTFNVNGLTSKNIFAQKSTRKRWREVQGILKSKPNF